MIIIRGSNKFCGENLLLAKYTHPGLGRRLLPVFAIESFLLDLVSCLSADSAPAPVRLRNVGLVVLALEIQPSVSGTGSRVKDLLIRSEPFFLDLKHSLKYIGDYPRIDVHVTYLPFNSMLS